MGKWNLVLVLDGCHLIYIFKQDMGQLSIMNIEALREQGSVHIWICIILIKSFVGLAHGLTKVYFMKRW